MVAALAGVLVLSALVKTAQGQDGQSATIRVDVHANEPDGPLPPIWNYFGYDEPNYTYAANGKKLLRELAELSPVPVYVRVHNLLTTGDGSASLKWGSTNVYTEDAAGKVIASSIHYTARA
jgi:xylan 1,4-beta-xylosidase